MANSTFSGTRFFSSAFNYEKSSPVFDHLYDGSAVWSSPNGQSYTGGWRPITPSDYQSNISLTGGNLVINVGAVAVTGNPQIQVSNFPASQNVAITGQPLNVTGNINVTNAPLTTLNVAITGSPIITITGNESVTFTNSTINAAITGNVIQNSGTFTPTFTGFTSGQIQIPVGVRAYNVIAESGGTYINGTLLNAGTSIAGGRYHNNYSLSTAINVGTTGGKVVVFYES